MSKHNCPVCRHETDINITIPCPACGAQLAIKKNRQNGNEFIACLAYPACRWAMSINRFMLLSRGIISVAPGQPPVYNKRPVEQPSSYRKITLMADENIDVDNLTTD